MEIFYCPVAAASADQVPDVRDILDWAYYRERLGSAIMKIITIPAAMQHVANPVPRIRHPDWLYKKVRERDDRFQQLRLDTMFAAQHEAKAQQADAAAAACDATAEAGARTDGGCGSPSSASEGGGAMMTDLEDMGQGGAGGAAAAARSRKRLVGRSRVISEEGGDAADAEAAAAGDGGGGDDAGPAAAHADQQPQPDWQEDYPGWLEAQKVKWRAARQDNKRRKLAASKRQGSRARDQGVDGDDAAADGEGGDAAGGAAGAGAAAGNLGAYLRQQQAVAARSHWQVLQLAPTATPGVYKMWVLVDASLYAVPLRVPRQVVINSTLAPGEDGAEVLGQPTKAMLPMTDTPYNLYQVRMYSYDCFSSLSQTIYEYNHGGRKSAVLENPTAHNPLQNWMIFDSIPVIAFTCRGFSLQPLISLQYITFYFSACR